MVFLQETGRRHGGRFYTANIDSCKIVASES